MLINAYCTHLAPPQPDFPHTLHNRRDRSDPEMVPHLRGFQGFVMQGGKRQMTQTRYHVLRHIDRVIHQLSMEVEREDMSAMGDWAARANAIIFLPDGTVRAPDGRVLTAPEHDETQPGAEVPYLEDASLRKLRTEKRLAAMGIPIMPSLPPVLSVMEARFRAPSEVAERALGLFLCAVRAESLGSQEPVPSAELMKKRPRAALALTPEEKAFLAADAPAQAEVNRRGWGYECVDAFRWALGASASLPFPAAPCDVVPMAKHVFNLDEAAFVHAASLRSVEEILDELDLVYRLHWATTDARVKGRAPLPGVVPGVVLERHRALNWLTRFDDAEWDEVDTPT
jgi:hypothetical protein